jgi:hypothetical protein
LAAHKQFKLAAALPTDVFVQGHWASLRKDQDIARRTTSHMNLRLASWQGHPDARRFDLPHRHGYRGRGSFAERGLVRLPVASAPVLGRSLR